MMSPKAMILLSVALLSSVALSGNTIPDIAGKTANLSTLVAAWKATDLISTLERTGPFTVFAPTNNAFNNLPFEGAMLKYLLNHKDKLTETLEYNVASGDFMSSDLKNGERIKMLTGDGIWVKSTNNTIMLNWMATVTTPDAKASNGVMHIIDEVLYHGLDNAPNIPVLVQAANLSTFWTAVEAAGLFYTFSSYHTNAALTVFAPTNAAFAALPDGVLTALLKPENIKSLVQVVEYHVHHGLVTAEDIKSGKQQIDTLWNRSKLNITKIDSEVKVNTANVTSADNFAVNGVVHVIDAVLLPPGWTPPNSTIAAKILV